MQHQNITDMKTAAMLLRVSTEQQDLESQRNDLLPVANSLGYNVPEEYIFGQKITGRDNIKKEDRKSIKELKEACKDGNIQAIFIWEVSRLSRNSIAGRQFVADFNEMKIPIYFKDRGIWTLDPVTKVEDSNTKTIVGLYFDFAESELKTFKNRSLRGRKQNAKNGLVTGGFIRYGYKKDPETKRYVIDEQEADFVRDLYTKYATGEYSIRRLTIYANSTDNPTRYKKSSSKGSFKSKSGIVKATSSIIWTTQVIRGILADNSYTGTRIFKDVAGNIPAIITEDLFNEVQEKLKQNPTKIEKSKHTHLLQKIMFCGNCGALYYGSYKDRSNAYLCSEYTRTARNCNNTSLNYERAESIIWDYIKNQTYFFKQISEEEKDKLINQQMIKKDELISIKHNYENLIQKEELKVKNLLNLVKNSNGAFSMSDIVNDKTEIDNNIKTYNNELIRINEDIDLIDNRINHLNNQNLTEQALKNIESDRKLMKEKIKETIDKIVVYKLDNYIALLQVYYLEKAVNLLYFYRKKVDRYYFVKDEVATFNKPNDAKMLDLPIKLPDFSVTSSNNEVFNGEVFGEYTGLQMINILEKYKQYKDYAKFDKIIPEIIK